MRLLKRGMKNLQPNNITETQNVWQNYFKKLIDWRTLVQNSAPIEGNNGLIYSLPNPIERHNESFAIADMSGIIVSEPHYHPEVELYFLLQGSGFVVIGGKEKLLSKNAPVTIPSNIAHFTVPEKDLVIAIINTPPFDAEHYSVLTENNATVGFNKKQFEQYV